MIKDPIYSSPLSIKFDVLWINIFELSKNYSIKKIDERNGIIILDLSYPIRTFMYFTWVEEVIISIKFLDENSSLIKIYGNVLLSPHHFFRMKALNNKKVDKDSLLNNIKKFFKSYEIHKTRG